MSPGDRTEDQDQDDQYCAGWDCVAEQRDGHIPARQPLGHDARTDNRCQQ
jgi:hypothetical protein